MGYATALQSRHSDPGGLTLEGCSISPPLPCPPGILKRQHLFFLSAKWNSGTCSRKHRILISKMQLVRGYP